LLLLLWLELILGGAATLIALGTGKKHFQVLPAVLLVLLGGIANDNLGCGCGPLTFLWDALAPVTIIDGNTLSYTLEGVCLLVSDLNMLMLRRVQGNNIWMISYRLGLGWLPNGIKIGIDSVTKIANLYFLARLRLFLIKKWRVLW
jgi:hypothetical protein